MALLAAALLTAATASPHAGSKPHLVFLLQDDLGHYDVAFNGNAAAEQITYNITKLARSGIVLDNHFVHWHCSPTRRSFITGRLPVHHHEQLSGVTTDDIDLRYSWISDKLHEAGYESYWFGKGHTGYKSMKHLPAAHHFKHFVGFLGGSQSYRSTDRWEDESPMTNDTEFRQPPASCVPPGVTAHDENNTQRYGLEVAEAAQGCGAIIIYNQTTFRCNGAENRSAATSADACCADCAAAGEGCSHWSFDATATATGTQTLPCSMWPGRCTTQHTDGATSGVMFHPTGPPGPPAPKPSPTPPDGKCHADTYSTTLYGELCLQAIEVHDPTVPFFLYFAIQAVHTPYDPVPFWTNGSTYMGMLWDSDVYIGAIANELKAKGMYDQTLIVYSADNGGPGLGLNYPMRGEKHTNWNGGLRAAAFVSGGLIPHSLRGTSSVINCHIVDWYPTFSYLAGVDGTDDPPEPPGPVDPSNPAKSIYGANSYPGVDGVNLWPWLISNPSGATRSSAHPSLVLSKEVIIKGNYKLLVAQNFGWSHSSDNGWKLPDPESPSDPWTGAKWTKPTVQHACDVTDGPGHLATLPGVPGQLPCLFDIDVDAGEHKDLGAEPANRALVMEMWAELNRTVLTAFCKGVNGSSAGSTGCNSSPVDMLGHCNPVCAEKYWGHSHGPVCGVPGC